MRPKSLFAPAPFAAAVIAASLLLPVAARAQTPPAQPIFTEPTDATRKAAAALNEKLQFTSQLQPILANVRGQIILGLARANNRPPEQVQPIVDELLMPDFTAHAGDLANTIVERWAASFTAADLEALLAFYSTPLGEKLLKALPAINQQVMHDGSAWAQGIFQASLQTHAAALRERGINPPAEGGHRNGP